MRGNMFNLIIFTVCFLLASLSAAVEDVSRVWRNEDLSIRSIHNIEIPPFFPLQQNYECEFSIYTDTETTPDGYYDQKLLMSYWSQIKWDAYVFYKGKIPVGLAVVNYGSKTNENFINRMDMAEFYISPLYRKQQLGITFAHALFDLYPGKTWEVRQLPKATGARDFWRTAISRYTNFPFMEYENYENWPGFVQIFSKDDKPLNKSSEKLSLDFR